MARSRAAATTSGQSEREAIRRYYEHRLIDTPASPPWAGLLLPDGSPLAPVAIGPTWQIGEDGRWVLPTLTIGWQALEWCGMHLQHDGQPWQFTDEQARFLLWWYSLSDGYEFAHPDGVLQRLKGWGKDPVAATISAIELVGPCRVNGNGEVLPDGNPAAVPHDEAWVQLAAVALSQTKNTMRLFPRLFTREAKAEHGLQIGKETIYAYGGERLLEAVTSSPATLEGGRPTCAIKNEPHHWKENNDGHEMAAVMERNSTKSEDGSSRTLSITNSFEPGEDSVAERERDAYEGMVAGLTVHTGMLYDSLEAQADAPLAVERLGDETTDEHVERTISTITAVLLSVRGDSAWLNIRRLVKSILSPSNPPSRSRRFWYNQVVASEDAWVTRPEWDAAAIPAIVPEGTLITLGFDGSRSDDHSALIGCVVETGHLFQIKVWVPDEHTGQVDRHDIDLTVRATFETWDVVGFFSDVHPWESYVDTWGEDLGGKLCVRATKLNPVGFDMRTRSSEFVPALERFLEGIKDQTVSHCGSKAFSQHAYNCRRMPGKYGISVWKGHREGARKIDSVPAANLARMCRQAYMALPSSQQRRKRTKVRAYPV